MLHHRIKKRQSLSHSANAHWRISVAGRSTNHSNRDFFHVSFQICFRPLPGSTPNSPVSSNLLIICNKPFLAIGSFLNPFKRPFLVLQHNHYWSFDRTTWSVKLDLPSHKAWWIMNLQNLLLPFESITNLNNVHFSLYGKRHLVVKILKINFYWIFLFPMVHIMYIPSFNEIRQ